MSRPNLLPPEHARDDYDFLNEQTGAMVVIRVPRIVEPYIFVNIPPRIWCKRHGWENELFEENPDD